MHVNDNTQALTEERLLTPAEVAAVFHVSVKTVSRWALAGNIDSIKTPGGHRRYYESAIRAALNAGRP